MVTPRDYLALYPEHGGSAKGFRCELRRVPKGKLLSEPCEMVTKTERGMRLHLLRVHGIKQQGVLFEAGAADPDASAVKKG